MKTSKHTPSVIAATLCQRRNYSCSSRILKPELSTQWQILRSELSTQWQILRSELSTQWPHPVASFRTVGGCFRYRISLPYQRSLFFTQSASENASRTREACFEHRMLQKMRRVPEEAVLRTECQFRTVGGCFRYRISLPYHSQKG